MQVNVRLTLPRDVATVSVSRQILRSAMAALGGGQDQASLRAALPHPNAEQGRGLHLIHMLTENVRMDAQPRRGMVMHFEKKLTWEKDAPGIRLS